MKEMMKDSGIEWIGVIPEEWEVHPLYFYFFERNNKNLLEKEKNLLSLSYGRIIRKDIETWEGLLPENFKNYNTIEKDDIVIRPTDLQNDQRSLRTGIARERGIITSVYITLAKKRALVPSYFHYLLHSYDLCKVFYEMGGGVRQALRYAELSKLPALEPPLTEQRTIAAFLDSACAKIDGIIADLEHQIDLLKEYKKSLITETVTKGLDKHVKLKDSGIAWIGEIPEHWEVKRLKYLGSARNGLTYTPSDITSPDTGILVLRSSNIQNNELEFSDTVYVSMNIPTELRLKLNDILICSRNGSKNLIGKCALINNTAINATYGAFMCIFRSKHNKFLYYVFLSGLFDYYLASFSTSTVNQLTNQNLYNMVIPFIHDKTEQQDIASFLDTRCAEIDSIIKGKEEQIEQQKEYKKSLIYEYVTGKKRVKEVY